MDDYISRQAAIDALELQAKEMSRWAERYTEQAKGVLTAKNVIEDLPSAQPENKQQATVSSDCISRQAAIEALKQQAETIMNYLIIKDRKALDITTREQLSKMPEVTPKQADMMLHAIGADHKKPRRQNNGRTYYHAYRNYYDAGGRDLELWDDLAKKGYARGEQYYHVTPLGLELLERLTQSTIYDDYENYADCRHTVLTEFMKDSVYCGYGCWYPTAATDIARRLHIPLSLAREACRKLVEEGYLVKDHFGWMDDDGYVHCYHGYSVTDKTREMEEWKALWKKECEYINSTLK